MEVFQFYCCVHEDYTMNTSCEDICMKCWENQNIRCMITLLELVFCIIIEPLNPESKMGAASLKPESGNSPLISLKASTDNIVAIQLCALSPKVVFLCP